MSELKDILELHPSLELITDGLKVKCSLSGHEMPAKVDVITTYTQGKKYKKLKKEGDYDFEIHNQHIVPSFKKGHEHQLFCRLTFRHISKEAKDVERHINGRRYKRALLKYEECQRLGVPFKPNKPQKRNVSEDVLREREKWNAEDGAGSSGDESVDSLSDLYPAKYFPESPNEPSEEEDSESEMVVESPVDKQPKKDKAIKRKKSEKSMEETQPKKKKVKKSIGKKINSRFENKMKRKPKIK
ncbi:surfeit locus protein 2-like [Antedon mediterranea]|uniref:surfeit locus protein 2-like n=1 Tax=Antedon mediterranea TaxID=105859 RepID=UPI003AF81880